MSANPCGCDPEAGHECTTHRIQHLEELVQVLQDDLAETRKAPAPCVWRGCEDDENYNPMARPSCQQEGDAEFCPPLFRFCPYCGHPLTVEQ